MNPLVTIITPSFNQGKYLEQTIVSVLNQTYKNIEYIVIDGGSSDNTMDILKTYSDRLKFISEKDNGQADAINKGLKMANGVFVGWINSDDLLASNCVELAVKALVEDEHLGIVYGNYVAIDSNGRYMNTVKNNKISLYRLLNIDCGLSQPGSFYRREHVEKVSFLDETLNYVMDYDLWIKLLKISKIKYLDHTMAYFRLHEESKTVSELEKFAPEIEKVLKKNNGSIYALPSKYIKEHYYEEWYSVVKKLVINVFSDCIGEKIGLYGTGAHTRSLLDICNKLYGSKRFDFFLFDSNKEKWSKQLDGYEILSPDKINNVGIKRLIISSFSYQDEIYSQIKMICNPEIHIVKLYDKNKNIVFFT